MATRVVKQAVIPGSQYDWQGLVARLPKLLVLFAICGIVIFAKLKVDQPDFLPITKVRAQGEFVNLTEQMLINKVNNIQGGYFNIDVRQIQENIEIIPWVEKAYIKREWPDTLVITVTEQRPYALWHEKGLINERGKLFQPATKTFPANLPRLSGPEGMHEQVLKHFQSMQDMLLKSSLEITALHMDARRAITLVINDGLEIRLGREAHYVRLNRFIRVYNKLLASQVEQYRQVDMRYTNGFTLLRKQ